MARHESFQLWESDCKSFLNTKNNDFITLNKEGMWLLSLGVNQKREIMSHEGLPKMVHSLTSCDFLKLEVDNHILFECAKPGKKHLSIEQEIRDWVGNEEQVRFQNLYKIKIWKITLRELLLFTSIYVCREISDIVSIVTAQPKPAIFFKSCLEFDCSNMTSILSFDSRSMECLLNEQHQEYFSSKYPLFYINKIAKCQSIKRAKDIKYFYRSALEVSLKSNQVKAVEIIIAYIV